MESIECNKEVWKMLLSIGLLENTEKGADLQDYVKSCVNKGLEEILKYYLIHEPLKKLHVKVESPEVIPVEVLIKLLKDVMGLNEENMAENVEKLLTEKLSKI